MRVTEGPPGRCLEYCSGHSGACITSNKMISKQLISPQSIAVIGGTNAPATPGGSALKNLIISNFEGKIFVVNANEPSVQGFRTYRDVMEIPDTDLAIIAEDDGDSLKTIEILATKKECKAIVIYPDRMTGKNSDGTPMPASEIEERIKHLTGEFGISVVGPNSAGVLTTSYSGLYTDTLPCAEDGIDIISSSRTTISFMIEAAKKYGLRISNIFSVGYSDFTSVEDILEWMDNDNKENPQAHRVIAVYIEKITDAASMLEHCRSMVKRGVGIVAIKGGCTNDEVSSGISHTGVLTSSTNAVGALFRKCGIIRAYGRERMMNIAAILHKARPEGNKIAILTQAGGPAVMLSDALASEGVNVSSIFFEDFSFGKSAGQISSLIDKYDKDPEIDATVVIFGCRCMSDTSEVYNVMFRKIRDTDKPIYPLFPSASNYEEYINEFHNKGGITFHDEVIFGKALANVINYPEVFEDSSSPAIDKRIIKKVVSDCPDGWIPPFMVQQLLDASGIDRLRQALVNTPEEAAKAAISIGYPVVLKAIGPFHRTEVDGISLNITDEHTLRTEYQRMMNIEEVTGFIVQPMINELSTELFIGAKREKNFGSMIMCGLGGIFIEALKDISFSLAPVSVAEADNMISSLKSYPIIQGYRGKEGVNQIMLNETIRRVSALCMAAPEIVEMDLNPLIGDEDGVTVIGARIRIDKGDYRNE